MIFEKTSASNTVEPTPDNSSGVADSATPLMLFGKLRKAPISAAQPVTCATTSAHDFFTLARDFVKGSNSRPVIQLLLLTFVVPYIEVRRSASLALNSSL
ncbi:TPA: hypothetical protein DCZ39_01200 [Patescibacteria group bacterium]|nr:hypothetical protein [Candidatus Gracilibacteria bacterium]